MHPAGYFIRGRRNRYTLLGGYADLVHLESSSGIGITLFLPTFGALCSSAFYLMRSALRHIQVLCKYGGKLPMHTDSAARHWTGISS